MRLRQVALVARRLEPAVTDLVATLDVAVVHRDPGVGVFGLENAVLALGDTFLEVVSPVRPDASAARYLDRHGEDGGYMVILQVDDLATARARATGCGARVVWEVALPTIATVHLHPNAPGGAILSLDQATPPASWEWAGPAWRDQVRTTRVAALTGVTIGAPDVAPLAARWGEVLGLPIVATPGGPTLPLAGGAIRFVPDARPARIRGITVAATAPDAIQDAARARGLATTAGGIRVAGVEVTLGSRR